MAKQTGIRARHGRACRTRDGGSCNCTPSFEAWDDPQQAEAAVQTAIISNCALALRLRVLPELGERRLAAIDLRDLLDLQEKLLGEGNSASVIRNSFVPLQAVLRRARRRGAIAVNPALDLHAMLAQLDAVDIHQCTRRRRDHNLAAVARSGDSGGPAAASAPRSPHPPDAARPCGAPSAR